jgi:predicted ATP-grasp superfamily ATP-dependent carboligase
MIVKARRHGNPVEGAPLSRLETEIARSDEEAVKLLAALKRQGHEALLQEAIEGQLMALVMVVGRDGRTLIRSQQVADAIWPAGAGISVRARTVEVDNELADRAMALLGNIGWHGLAELQFVLPGSGAPALIDVNPRFYGSMALAVAAGADVPRVWLEDAIGHAAPEGHDARPGVRYQWLEGDLRRVAQENKNPVDLLGTFIYAVGATHSISSSRDPVPLLRHSLELIRRATRKVFKRLLPRRRPGEPGHRPPS